MVGHIFLSKIIIDEHQEIPSGLGLSPMTVLPEYQNMGIESALIKNGLKIITEKQIPYIIVMGHQNFYQKFGFAPAAKHGILCRWNGIPHSTFMIYIIDQKLMKTIKWIAKYRNEFNNVI